jgi:LysW-gamma-L-lysine carboxypeptidase
MVSYGPGDSGLDHAPDEHLPLAAYADAIDVLTAVARRLTQGA